MNVCRNFRSTVIIRLEFQEFYIKVHTIRERLGDRLTKDGCSGIVQQVSFSRLDRQINVQRKYIYEQSTTIHSVCLIATDRRKYQEEDSPLRRGTAADQEAEHVHLRSGGRQVETERMQCYIHAPHPLHTTGMKVRDRQTEMNGCCARPCRPVHNPCSELVRLTERRVVDQVAAHKMGCWFCRHDETGVQGTLGCPRSACSICDSRCSMSTPVQKSKGSRWHEHVDDDSFHDGPNGRTHTPFQDIQDLLYLQW